MTKVWTRPEIEKMLNENPAAVERGILVLWRHQTSDEQNTQQTRHTNGRGFASWAANKGTYYANWINSGRRLTGHHLDYARKIALYHVGQIVEVANTPRE
jgi:hypothetical protein